MGAILFIVVLFVVFVGGGWYIGRSIGGLIESKNDNYPTYEKNTYIDNSVHYNVHQNLTVIDEEIHARGLGHFSNKKDSRNG